MTAPIQLADGTIIGGIPAANPGSDQSYAFAAGTQDMDALPAYVTLDCTGAGGLVNFNFDVDGEAPVGYECIIRRIDAVNQPCQIQEGGQNISGAQITGQAGGDDQIQLRKIAPNSVGTADGWLIVSKSTIS